MYHIIPRQTPNQSSSLGLSDSTAGAPQLPESVESAGGFVHCSVSAAAAGGFGGLVFASAEALGVAAAAFSSGTTSSDLAPSST